MPDNTKKEWVIGLIACLICVIVPFASDSYVPSMPAITKDFGSSVNHIQLTMTFYFLGGALSQLFFGPFSDKHGRRIMVLAGLGICTIGSFFCVFSTSVVMLIGARFLQGFGAGACNSLFRAILRDYFSGSRLAQIGSYIGIIYPVTFAVAPILGGYVESIWGWRESFLLVALIVFLTLLTVMRYLPETNQQLDSKATQWSTMLRNYMTLISHPKFMGYTLLSSLTFAGFICYYSVTPFLLQDIVGLTPVQFGWLSVFISAGIIVSQFLNSRLVMKYGIQFMIKIGVILMTLSGLAMLLFGLLHMINTWVIVLPAVIFSLASGFVFSNAMAGAFEFFGHMAGIAGAMYAFLQMMGAVITGLLLANTATKTQIPLALIFTGIGCSTVLIFYLLSKHENSSHR